MAESWPQWLFRHTVCRVCYVAWIALPFAALDTWLGRAILPLAGLYGYWPADLRVREWPGVRP